MSDTSTDKDVFKYIDTWLQEIAEIVQGGKPKSPTNDITSFESINHLLNAIEDDHHRGILREILKKTRELSLKNYTSKLHISLIIDYELFGANLKGNLLSPLIDRLQQHLKKEIRYLRMQAPESELFQEISKKASASVANLLPLHGKPDQQQSFINVLLSMILDYRLSTLKEEQAWDFIAQSILNKTGIRQDLRYPSPAHSKFSS